jgi:hypothetical protein
LIGEKLLGRVLFCSALFFETASHNVAQGGHELPIFLPHTPESQESPPGIKVEYYATPCFLPSLFPFFTFLFFLFFFSWCWGLNLGPYTCP